MDTGCQTTGVFESDEQNKSVNLKTNDLHEQVIVSETQTIL